MPEQDGKPAINVGINGFGRIGRQCVRILIQRPNVNIKHINSTQTSDYMKYLLEHDTVHGRFKGTIVAEKDALIINDHRISLSCTRDAESSELNPRAC